MWTDLKNALRALRAAPLFTAVALIILALGIGATTAIFSVVDAVILRGLPFAEADRLVSVGQGRSGTGAQAPQNYLDWRAGQQVFDGLAAVTGGGGYVLRTGGEGRNLRTRRVTHELFAVLRVAPIVGRTFSAEHEVDGRHQVAVVSYGFWQQEFGGDPGVVGRTMALDNGAYEILGVMPAGFAYPVGLAEPPEMWVPYVVPPSERTRGTNRSFYLQLVGRLKPGVSIEQAETQLELITAPLAAQSPDWFKEPGMSVRSLHETLVGRVRSWMLLLFGMVAFVLLLACVNVANLMLARATARERDLGIRSALGASRWRIARGLLIESLVLSSVGTAIGLIVAWMGVEILRSTMPADVPRLSSIAIDARVLALSAAAALSTGLLFGLLPALQFSRPNLTHALADGGRSATAGIVRQRVRSALVVGEVALAVVLLVGSALFVSSFARVMAIDLGIGHERVLTLGIPLGNPQALNELSPSDRRIVMARNQGSLEAVLERVRLVPGIERAAISAGAMPLTTSSNTTNARVPSTGKDFTGAHSSAEIKRVTDEYHDAMGIPLRSGRLFTPQDRDGSAPVVIINDVAATLYFEGAPAVGQALAVQGDRTVVGVVGSVRQNGPEQPLRPEAYIPLTQSNALGGELIVRTNGNPAGVLPDVKRAVLTVLPQTVFPASRSMDELLRTLVAQRRFNMLLFSLFGVLGLAIAVIGVFGVMAYIVEQRTMEFGVRMALGASRRRILTTVLVRASVFMGVGLVVGLGAALALSRFVGTFLFEVRPGDPLVYTAVAALLVVVGLVAALVPAFRASRVDPIIALRTQ